MIDEIQGKDGEWVPATSLLGCCDCGLVHRMEYRLLNKNGVDLNIDLYDVQLMVRSVRDRELTQKARTEKNFVCKLNQREKR